MAGSGLRVAVVLAVGGRRPTVVGTAVELRTGPSVA